MASVHNKLFTLRFKWQQSTFMYDIIFTGDLNFCAWFMKTWILFEPEDTKLWNYFYFVGNDTDILHYILESQQVSLLPTYIRNEVPRSCLFGVHIAEFVVCWKYLLGDFIFLCCMQNATFSWYSSVFPSPPLRTIMQCKTVLNSEYY